MNFGVVKRTDDLRTFGGLGVSLFTGSVIAFVLGFADAGDPFSS